MLIDKGPARTFTTFLENRLGVEAEVEVPAGFTARRRFVPHLGYPAELFGVTNQEIRPTRLRDLREGLPRVEFLRSGGMFVWVTVGDYAFDNGAAELTGPKRRLSDDEIRSRAADRIDLVPPLSERDSGGPGDLGWPNLYIWTRSIVLSKRHYLTIYAFAHGPGRFKLTNRPPDELAAIVGSLRLRDYS